MRANAAGVWQTPVIKHMTAGTLHIESIAIDNAFNFGQAPIVTAKVR
jgi:hypothetical protein